MKILEFNQKQQEVTIKVENLYDLWILFNLISKNDIVSARTQRRIILKEGSKGERKPMYLKLKVEDVSFHEFSNRLRIKGTILEGPEDFVSYGTYHTFNIEIGQKLRIYKEKWLKTELKRLSQISKFESNFVMLLIAVEQGLATLAIITNFSHTKIATIKKNIPGKRYEQSYRNKAVLEFFDDIKKVMEENLKNFHINLIVICGPGNTRDNFIRYLKDKINSQYISKIKSIYASSGTESAVLEALKSKELGKIKSKVKVLLEAEKIEEIFRIFSTDADLIVIGTKEVLSAIEKGAIKELFLTDTMIRGASKNHKLIIEKIITGVENSGGNINILSSEHPTGRQIDDLGSIIGILRYKL
ncbi:MAG: mRNA surveillance protein pelota [Promethearchaeota archaeon]